MQAEIIAIGSELLLGTTVDTNSAYLARQLARAGVELVRKSSVGDDTERIATMVSEALARADLVICTGGLGPTLDDVTREGVALAMERPLEFHQTLLDQIEARFTAMGRTMSPSNRRQAYVPTGARIVENPRGTAPAFIVEDDRGTVIVLPGVPYEMRYLFENAVMPYLRDERGITDAILVKTIHATGLGESVIGEMIADLMAQTNPSVGISAKQARYEIRITAHGASQAEAEAMLATTEATIRERLKQHVIGDEPLPATVARLLKEQQLTLALYETSTLAPIFRALSAVNGGTECISGVLIHPLDRAANEDAAAILSQTGAFGIVDRWRADLGLAFQVADTSDQSGLTAVSVTLVTPKGNRQVTRNYDLRQTEGWEFVATLGLDLIRRYLVGEAA
ncbi:competence/damage-inducible protein A [Candidatus Chloroploca asiatica]|uniref:CinA-like protein n=1 Tax=Candidatus Chloroploca asiatica TaxID=1506545 RepID=A0A2H3KI89_9CHLR|nr:CinA family nicotinamide mononucleotide deamidase-related protein [Candidatus Chloroploca asiatica]PDV97529.1 competence/damage-inducible protein A [Candidatus Chloroploca asiatica]